MKIILTAENPQLYSSQRLFEEAKNLGLIFEHLNPLQSKIKLCREDGQQRREQDTLCLHRSTGIRFDDFDLCLARQLQTEGASIINPLETITMLRDKLSQHLFFFNHQIPAIETYALRGRIDSDEISSIADQFSKKSKTEKYIVKTERGNKGIGVNLLESKRSLLGLLETFWGMQDQRFIIQPYLPGDEYRVLIINGDVSGIILKETKNDQYRKNANRASGEYRLPHQVPSAVLDVALDCFKKTGAVVAGIDLIENEFGIFVLECNLVPGFELMENLSKKNHAQEIILAAIDYHQRRKQ